jgi:hypothetical protein
LKFILTGLTFFALTALGNSSLYARDTHAFYHADASCQSSDGTVKRYAFVSDVFQMKLSSSVASLSEAPPALDSMSKMVNTQGWKCTLSAGTGLLGTAASVHAASAARDEVIRIYRQGLGGVGISWCVIKYAYSSGDAAGTPHVAEDCALPRTVGTGRTFTHTSGSFTEQTDGRWIEKATDGVYNFTLDLEDATWLYLRDSSRTVNVRLPLNGGGSAYQNGPLSTSGTWNELYEVRPVLR